MTSTTPAERIKDLERMLAKSRNAPGYGGRAMDIEAEIARLKAAEQ